MCGKLNLFDANVTFPYFLKVWKSLVFWCFQWEEKWNIGLKWLMILNDADLKFSRWSALYRIFLFKISLLWALGKKTNRYWEMGLLWKIFTKNYSFVQTGRKFYSFNGHTGNNNKILIRLLCDFIHVFHLQLLQLENFLHFLDLLFS